MKCYLSSGQRNNIKNDYTKIAISRLGMAVFFKQP